MKIAAIIPARYQSSRFPGKPVKFLNDKMIIQHVYDNVKASNLFDAVIVATDDQRIFDAVEDFGGKVEMTSKNHQSGSDRVAEVCKKLDVDIVVNVQGDEPFIDKKTLEELISVFEDKKVEVASLMHIIDSKDAENPNIVKVVVKNNMDALYFSRSKIPFNRDGFDSTYYGHVGVYAFKKNILLEFVKLEKSKLEGIEKLEQLRLLENNYQIKMVLTDYQGIGIDSPEDLAKAVEMINNY
jgi:3-deoxy-manno-octulosonate cytidylyltransferase (CMP-KDO synthetase)